MQYGVLGTGAVGTAVGTKLVELGHEVCMGSRSASNQAAAAWTASAGERARHGTFADAAAFGEVLVNATGGAVSVEVLEAAREESLGGKVLVDISNAIDKASGFPPRLTVANTDSIAEQIQRRFQKLRVVKALNTVNAEVMVNPGMIEGSHNIFIAGNDASAKAEVARLLTSFGWDADDIIDLGDVTNARALEMYLALWIRLMRHAGSPRFNIRVVRAA